VSVFPIVFDASAPYLGRGSTSRSLLLAPLGAGTLLCRLHERFSGLGAYKLTVATSFTPDAAYRAALHAACRDVDRIVSPTDFSEFVAALEPSDWLLFVDPTCVPTEAINPDALIQTSAESPRSAIHMVALETNVGGTCERVDLNDRGEVTRIRRYYDDVTWSYASGVAASLVPVSCLMTATGLRIDSLKSLRSALASIGVPARDVALSGRTFNLAQEREMLMFTERATRELTSTTDKRRHVASTANIHSTARLIGPVVIQDGACIDANATVVGPAVVGAHAHIGADALVVQCVVRSGTLVPPESTWRQQVLSEDPVPERASAERADDCYDPFAVGPFGADARERPGRRRVYPILKLIVESTAAILALVILSPLLLLVAALIKLESSGPVLFRDRRESRGGRNFGCLKFRTMFQGADAMQRQLMAQNEMDGPQFKLDKDPRVTRIGRWIRPCSLDELPQLINVAIGDMSLVGPRPSPFRENQTCVPWREGRLSVRPGITGLWQVCRHDRDKGDFHQWIHYDLLYVEHMSALVDLKIIAATILTLGGKWCVPLTWIIPARRLQPAAR
jgi:lipopolysaccharide/colanic/teichoic acid biosynthesis glycosyltransferase/carbonic anhydrase/acetyltransferase-like protein (isoleucine patch superfamily)